MAVATPETRRIIDEMDRAALKSLEAAALEAEQDELAEREAQKAEKRAAARK